jgi:hypothetical protein
MWVTGIFPLSFLAANALNEIGMPTNYVRMIDAMLILNLFLTASQPQQLDGS